MQLTEHFSISEMTDSATALRLGIDNTPSVETFVHLAVLAAGLERVRSILGTPLLITSGYRSPALNKAIGGAPDSAHILGYAADIKVAGRSPLSVCAALLETDLKFDQLINEGTWTHISFDKTLRQQVLTAYFSPSGRASYVPGLHR